MKTTFFTVLCVLLLSATSVVKAQDDSEITYSNDEFKGLYLGATASTNGWGGELKYLFNKRFTVRSGYETFKFSRDFVFEENDVDYDATVDFTTGGIFVLGDFNYTRNLYVSAGVVFNKFNPVFSGYAVSDIQYGDITIPAEMVGDFEFTMNPELKASPYASLGVRTFFGKKKTVNFGTEIGCYYMGAPEIDIVATGLISPTADPAHGQKERLENQISQYKFYPVLKFNLAVKLF